MKWNHSQHHWFSQCPTGDGKAGVWIQFPLSPAPVTCPRGTGCCPLTSEQALCLEGWQAHSSCFPSPLSPQQLQARGTAQRQWLTGERVKPILNFRLNSSLSGGLKVNFCRSEVKKINNSVLANCSPRHIRFPKRQKYDVSYLLRWWLCLARTEILYHILKNLAKWEPDRPWPLCSWLISWQPPCKPKPSWVNLQSHSSVPSGVRMVRYRVQVQAADRAQRGWADLQTASSLKSFKNPSGNDDDKSRQKEKFCFNIFQSL